MRYTYCSFRSEASSLLIDTGPSTVGTIQAIGPKQVILLVHFQARSNQSSWMAKLWQAPANMKAVQPVPNERKFQSIMIQSSKRIECRHPKYTLSPVIMVQWKITRKNERKLILKIHPFSTSMVMGGRVMVANFYLMVVFQMGVHHPKKGIEVHLHRNKKVQKKTSTAASHHIKHGWSIGVKKNGF